MAKRFRELPSLSALLAFEAAARAASFKAAAVELNVTPGAVSRQIAALEDELGFPLFHRGHRAVQLTLEGEQLFAGVSDGFGAIEQTVRTVRHSRARADRVCIGTTAAFAQLWLMPRLTGFWRAHPEIQVDHVISDDDADVRFASTDLRVRYGTGEWEGEHAAHLLTDQVYPVASPQFARDHPVTSAADIADLALLSLHGVDPRWTTWEKWLKAVGCSKRPPQLRRFSNYVVSLQAAQDGQGVALGWHSLVAPLIAARRLVRLGDLEIASPYGLYVTRREGSSPTPATTVLRDWLLQAAGEPSGST